MAVTLTRLGSGRRQLAKSKERNSNAIARTSQNDRLSLRLSLISDELHSAERLEFDMLALRALQLNICCSWFLSASLASALTPLAAFNALGLGDVLPNFAEEVLDPKYQVAISKHTLPENETADFAALESVTLRNKQGEEFVCYLPGIRGVEEGVEGEEVKAGSLPSELLDEMTGGCIFRKEDWWSYEVCYHKKIRQFHKHGDQIVAEFILGEFSGNTSEADTVLFQAGAAPLPTAYVKESYSGGTPCDVAERQRSTELRLVCAQDGRTAVTSVKELHSCSYEITVATPLLCAHPAFQSVEVPVQDIKCFPTVEPPAGLSDASSASSAGPEAAEVDTLGGQDDAEESSDEPILAVHLEDIDGAALDELIQNLIQMGSAEDPDLDFMGQEEKENEKDEL